MEFITATELKAITASVREKERKERESIICNWLNQDIFPACKSSAQQGESQMTFSKLMIPSECQYTAEISKMINSRGFIFSADSMTFTIQW